MNQVMLALIVALLAGGAGGYAVQLAAARDDVPAPDGRLAPDLSGIESRLAAIEAALDRPEPLTLEGRARDAADVAAQEAIAAAVARQLDAQVEDTVRASVREALAEMDARPGAPAPGTEGPRRREATLRDVAAELGLSAAEEGDLRRIYADTIEKAIDLLAGEHGDREAVRGDIERAKNDPSARMQMVGKYMPKIMPNIGEFISLQMERDQRIRQAIGEEKAERLKTEFDVEEADPFGFSGEMRIDARGR